MLTLKNTSKIYLLTQQFLAQARNRLLINQYSLSVCATHKSIMHTARFIATHRNCFTLFAQSHLAHCIKVRLLKSHNTFATMSAKKKIMDKLTSMLCGLINPKKQDDQSNMQTQSQRYEQQHYAPQQQYQQNQQYQQQHQQYQQQGIAPQQIQLQMQPQQQQNYAQAASSTTFNGIANVTVYVSSQYHGKLIGSKGATIKRLQDQPLGQIKISMPQRDSGDEAVRIQGPEAAVQQALQSIADLLGFMPSQQPTANHRPNGNSQRNSNTSFAPQGKIDLSPNRPVNHVLFFPDTDGSGSFEQFLAHLSSARSTCDIAVYNLADDRITRVIQNLQQSGVQIRIITEADCMSGQGNDIRTLAQGGIACRSDVSPALMHHKFAILDHQFVISGSLNWTRSAVTSNQENIVLTNVPSIVQQFDRQFEKMWQLPCMQNVE
jgi:hypothetical protein